MSRKQRGSSAKERSEQAKSARERVRANKQSPKSPFNQWVIIGGAVAIALIAIVISVIQSRTSVDQELVTKYESITAERNVLGNADAAVTVQVWEDFL